ncbi:neural cell adhesion molecule L1-like protein [Myotis lucifugus]|uniref:neural cell adhesion molecule L1-like protein n=1 Tax=Myotis lucifugus TaxID=59463 RepID=UPI0003C44172|nr:neural cell adhesion molecule L1-like protein [Myotis lucifugus]
MERLPGAGGAVFSLLSLLLHFASASEIPLSVPQVPTITKQSKEQVAFPFDEYFQIECEAKGNPEPRFTWTKDGKPFDLSDPRVIASNNSGTFRIPNEGQIAHFQGKYRCFASNKLGVAMSEEIEFIVPNVPKFPKEKIEPLEVEEGDPLVLPCNPPTGLPPLHIYWMNIELEHIQQDERVYMSQEGDLYFANVEEHDSRNDYCCFAAFPRLRTIVQKMPMKLTVNSLKHANDSGSPTEAGSRANSIKQRKPSLLLPPAARGPESSVTVLRGDTLVLECFAEGLPTPQVDWEKVGGDLPKGRETKENYGKMLKIENVSYEDKGNYRCTANNFLGVATHDFHVTVEGRLTSMYSIYLSACTHSNRPRIQLMAFTEFQCSKKNIGHVHCIDPPDNSGSVSGETMLPAALFFISINNLSVSTFPPASPRSRFLCSPRVRSSGRGLGKLPEGVNATEKVHPPEVPEPGAEHAVRLLPKNWVGNNSIFEDVIEARGREYAGLYDDIATQGWFIGLMGAVAGLTLVLLTVCFVKRNRGGKYSVKDKEDLHPDPDVQSGKDETFGDYSDSDEKPLKGSLRSLTRDLPATESADSLVPYGDGDHGLFSEDGSFIGAYAGSKEKGSVESNGSSTATFPLRA